MGAERAQREKLLSFRVFKAKPALFLVVGIMGLGISGAIVCFLRQAIYKSKIRWVHNDLERWNEQSPNYHYKFVGLTEDYEEAQKK